MGDKKMATVVQKASAAVILMHMRGKPANMQTGNLAYDDLMEEIITYLKNGYRKAHSAGIEKDQIVSIRESDLAKLLKTIVKL